MKKVLLVILFIAFCGWLHAQNADWVEQMDDPTVNFYTVQQNFETYWQERQIEKGKGWKQFKRWEAFWEPRVYPDGERPGPGAMMEALLQLQNNGSSNLGQWRPIGPYNGSTIDGIGRINRIAFDPTDNQTIWIGAPAGGLWKSTDGGQSWSTNTDQLANLGISDIVINPGNTNIMYIATGDRDGGDTYSFGILKSTDGGQTWNPTGMGHNVIQQTRITDIYLHPTNPDVLIASTSQGIYRSTDAANNWTKVQSGSFNAMVQKPGNPNVLFITSISSPRIYKSIDNGQSWNQVLNPVLPAGNVRRIELAVTPHDSNYIYALYGESSSNGFLAVCRSIDGGDTWTQQATSPNLLGWSTNGSDVGGQAWYDLALAVNPTNKNEVYVGGVNIWKSNNGGVNWQLAAHWYGGGGAPPVHADIHHLTYHPVTHHVYAGTDGGVYRFRAGQSLWDELNDGLNITQYYKMGTSASDTSMIIAGAQDNGTHLKKTSGWNDVHGGDGMDCAINSKNPDVMYASVYYGDFVKSTNGGQSFFANFNLPPAGQGNWVTPFLLDPKNPDTIYTGFSNVWRSFNGGATFNSLSASGISGMSNIDVLGIAPQHTNNIFLANGNRIYSSADYGNNWSHLNSLLVFRAISDIAVAHDDPDHIIVSLSGYSSSEKVFETTDGGQTWTNLSVGLPNLPVNCATIENNDLHSVYIGTDVGVFYRDDLSNGWIRFNSNLPNVIVNDLEINYINRRLRAATYGRGVWESPLYSDLVPPIANFNLPHAICVNDTVTLIEDAKYSPADFKWNISPANFTYVNGTNDSTPNLQLAFTQKGFYNVSLTVSNLLGKDSVFEAGAIVVGGSPLSIKGDFEKILDFKKWSLGSSGGEGWSREPLNGGFVLKASLFNSISNTDYELISPAIDFTGHDSVWATFDHAYNGQPGNQNDSLLVYVSTACADDWHRIAAFGEDGTDNFSTSVAMAVPFEPGKNEWCTTSGLAPCKTLNLSAYAGREGVRLKFVAVNEGGNHIYLDNIKIAGNPTTAPAADFNAPALTCALDTVRFNDQSYGSPQTWEWSFTGPANLQSQDRDPQIVFSRPGTYSVKLKTTNAIGADSVFKNSFITVNSADSVSIQLNYAGGFVCSSDTLKISANSINAGTSPSYNWFLNGQYEGNSATGSFDFINLQNGDTIYATLRSNLDCAFPALAFSDTAIVRAYPVTPLQITTVPALCSTGNAVTLLASPAGGAFTGPGVTGSNFDPKVAGGGIHTITYSYQDTNGCTATQNTTVQVQSPPVISINSTNTICEGDSPKALNIAIPTGGTYSGNGISNNILDPSVPGRGTHSITYTYTSPTCGAVSKTFSINISKTDTPEVFVGNNEMVCSITATAYQWFDSNNSTVIGANSKIFTPTTNGSYRVDIIDNNGCYASSAYADFSIGLNEWLADIEFKLYPNPARQKIFLEIGGANAGENIQVTIYNGIGAEVRRENFTLQNDFRHTFDMNGFSSGVYTFGLSGKNIQISKKIILQK